MRSSTKRSMVGLLFAATAMFQAAPASAGENQILKAMGNLRWGMDDLALKSALKGKLNAGSQHTEFNGQSTSWDSSPIGEEYTHGNEEEMYVSKDGDSENYFFFIGGQLWKWVKLYPASTFGRGGFKSFSQKIQKRFGKGYEKNGEVNPRSGLSYDFVEFMDRSTRLRAIDKTKQLGKYAIVFESMDTVRSLSALRGNTIRRGGPKAPSAVASTRQARHSDDEDEEEAPIRSSAGSSRGSSEGSASSGAKKKSLFADENDRGETDAEYAAKKARMHTEKREQQRNVHKRGEESKKGKTLDELAGINDDDPLGGMR